jgi:hypothetical protein
MRITSVRAWVLEARPEAGVVFGIGKFDTYTARRSRAGGRK